MNVGKSAASPRPWSSHTDKSERMKQRSNAIDKRNGGPQKQHQQRRTATNSQNGRKTTTQIQRTHQFLSTGLHALFPSINGTLPTANGAERAGLALLERDPLLCRASGGFRLFVRKFTDQQLLKCLRTPALNTLGQWAPPNLRYIHVLRSAWKKLTQFERFDWQELFEQYAKDGHDSTLGIVVDQNEQLLEASANKEDEQRLCQFQWLSTVDSEHLPCPLCSFGNQRRYAIGQLLAHLSLSHHSAHLYACHCCSTAFSRAEALKEHGTNYQCRPFLRYMRDNVRRISDELVFDFAYASLICAECGLHVLLSPRCDQDKLADTLLNLMLSHSNQSLSLCWTFTSVELAQPSVKIDFLRPVIFEPMSKCEFCLRSGWNSPMELERHCAMEHRNWAINNQCMLQCPECPAKFYTAPLFCDHLLSKHLHSDVPMVTQFLRTIPQFPPALDKNGTVLLGTVGIDRLPSPSPHAANAPATNPLKWVPAAERAAREGELRRSKRKRKRRRLHTPAPEDEEAADEDEEEDEEGEDDVDEEWDETDEQRKGRPSGGIGTFLEQQNFGRWKTKMRLLEARAISSTDGPLAEFLEHLQLPVQFSGNEMLAQNTLDGALLTESVYKCSKCNTILFGESSITDHIVECHQIERNDGPDFEQMLDEYVFDNVEVLFVAGNFPFTRIRCDLCQNDCCSVVSLRRHYAQCHGILCAFQPNKSTVHECAAVLLRRDWANTGFDRELFQQINSSQPPQCMSEFESECSGTAKLNQLGPVEISANTLYTTLVVHAVEHHGGGDQEVPPKNKNNANTGGTTSDGGGERRRQIVDEEEEEELKEEPMDVRRGQTQTMEADEEGGQCCDEAEKSGGTASSLDKTSDGDVSVLSNVVVVKEELNEEMEEEEDESGDCILNKSNGTDNAEFGIVGDDHSAGHLSSSSSPLVPVKNELSPNSSPSSNATFADFLHRPADDELTNDNNDDQEEEEDEISEDDDDDDKDHNYPLLVMDQHDDNNDLSDQHDEVKQNDHDHEDGGGDAECDQPVVDNSMALQNVPSSPMKKSGKPNGNGAVSVANDEEEEEQKVVVVQQQIGEDGQQNRHVHGDVDDKDGVGDDQSFLTNVLRRSTRKRTKRGNGSNTTTVIHYADQMEGDEEEENNEQDSLADHREEAAFAMPLLAKYGPKKRSSPKKLAKKRGRPTKLEAIIRSMELAMNANGARRKGGKTVAMKKGGRKMKTKAQEEDEEEWPRRKRSYTRRKSKVDRDEEEEKDDEDKKESQSCSNSIMPPEKEMLPVEVKEEEKPNDEAIANDEIEVIMKGMERHFHRKRGRPKKKALLASPTAATVNPQQQHQQQKCQPQQQPQQHQQQQQHASVGPSSRYTTAHPVTAACSSTFVCFMCTAVEKDFDAFGRHLRSHPEQWKRCTVCPQNNENNKMEEHNDESADNKQQTEEDQKQQQNQPQQENKSKKRRNFDHPVHFLKHLIEFHMNFQQKDRVQCPWCDYFIQFSLANQRYRASAAMFRHMVYECAQSNVCLLCGFVCTTTSSSSPSPSSTLASIDRNESTNCCRQSNTDQLVKHRLEKHHLIFDRFICFSCKGGFYSREQFLHHTCELALRCICNSSYRFLSRDEFSQHIQQNLFNLKSHGLIQAENELDIVKRKCVINEDYRRHVAILEVHTREAEIERETAKAVAEIKKKVANLSETRCPTVVTTAISSTSTVTAAISTTPKVATAINTTPIVAMAINTTPIVAMAINTTPEISTTHKVATAISTTPTVATAINTTPAISTTQKVATAISTTPTVATAINTTPAISTTSKIATTTSTSWEFVTAIRTTPKVATIISPTSNAATVISPTHTAAQTVAFSTLSPTVVSAICPTPNAARAICPTPNASTSAINPIPIVTSATVAPTVASSNTSLSYRSFVLSQFSSRYNHDNKSVPNSAAHSAGAAGVSFEAKKG
ncbi:hypothetical protein niasHS_000963 [Heterodera schachtii]|uniref:C2H2-type domain-containing protein n=1 Tax=Heterodera schachtii TaxID=97005 RepID=A0ABD2K7U5_HETSC